VPLLAFGEYPLRGLLVKSVRVGNIEMLVGPVSANHFLRGYGGFRFALPVRLDTSRSVRVEFDNRGPIAHALNVGVLCDTSEGPDNYGLALRVSIPAYCQVVAAMRPNRAVAATLLILDPPIGWHVVRGRPRYEPGLVVNGGRAKSVKRG
jgi:hypothetical protein